ncbi:MAG: hypothetical protein KDA84_14235, partial [Planctomycetaceae bacterium]|nr:hypothetical protein [Planctomycetaceae bacterium]
MILNRWFPILRRLVVSLVIVAIGVYSLGCGAILHPSRIGQERHGSIDPAICILDGLGLLLFFVPGAIAFAVDFGTGAIYLPPEGYGQLENESLDPSQCEVIRVPPEELSREKLETVLSERTGKPVQLTPGSYNVERLNEEQA